MIRVDFERVFQLAALQEAFRLTIGVCHQTLHGNMSLKNKGVTFTARVLFFVLSIFWCNNFTSPKMLVVRTSDGHDGMLIISRNKPWLLTRKRARVFRTPAP